MKAISLWQPWASLVVIGAKTWETRSWDTNYRGPLAIHAAKRWTPAQRDLIAQEPFKLALTTAGIYELPLGKVVGKVELTFTTQSPANGMIWLPHMDKPFVMHEPEQSFGDFSKGRFAWLLENPECLGAPVPERGRQRFWTFAYPQGTEE